MQVTSNNAFERTGGHRGRAVLAMNCALWASPNFSDTQLSALG